MRAAASESPYRAEREAHHVLTQLGFNVRAIPTTSTTTADFEVTGDAPDYLVEVKARFLDERLANPKEPCSEPVIKSMRHDAKVGDWLAQATAQFRGVDPEHRRLWFVWLTMESRSTGTNQAERTGSVLYGAREAMNVDPPNERFIVFYANRPAFDRFPNIDGAIIIVGGTTELTFCPNEASPRLDAVMNSKLVRELRDRGVTGMLPGERGGPHGYVVPPSSRGDAVFALRALQQATGLPYLTFMAIDEEYQQTGRIRIPGDDG